MRKEQVFTEADFFLIEPLRHLHKEKYKWPPIEGMNGFFLIDCFCISFFCHSSGNLFSRQALG